MSVRAIRNIRALCEELLTGRYELAVIDIYQHPETASLEQIIVTPTLVKLLPSPSRRIVGDLSDRNRLMAGLGVATGGMMVRSPARIDEFRRKRNGF